MADEWWIRALKDEQPMSSPKWYSDNIDELAFCKESSWRHSLTCGGCAVSWAGMPLPTKRWVSTFDGAWNLGYPSSRIRWWPSTPRRQRWRNWRGDSRTLPVWGFGRIGPSHWPCPSLLLSSPSWGTISDPRSCHKSRPIGESSRAVALRRWITNVSNYSLR